MGELLLDGIRQCVTLEWITREQKLPGKTGIPAGKYQLLPRRAGEMHRLYSNRFHCNHPMIWLQDVPGFEYVYIHIGNGLSDSKGCILVGTTSSRNYDANYYLRNSYVAYVPLHKAIAAAWGREEEVWLEVIESHEK
ncbi:MAG: hypothetical protein GX421_12535 [Caldisericales bacterium]|nr:hypothetical protein [Caldisericales bacterium]